MLAVFGAVKEARERALAGEGASFLEMVTYRIGAHSSSDDPRVYRDEREVEEWKKKDPLERTAAFQEQLRKIDPEQARLLRRAHGQIAAGHAARTR